ncbi:hypothetical protein GPY51_10885 [Photorhabdus laumondii subsp. laumondii]|uniref:Uncharacterized protein n=1 Tax=Photorhabdus laumondii subsp. laumondii TaxID=141679 RepID=A0A6L9JJI7_PHOLM|nr:MULTISPECIES: hypothetical protein [Photorhabdus]MCC8384620.1 hypothetical protein [Photorhabdus laumondii]MCC8413334.1 hypothetical protein [Photorhabdus laumondii]MCC8421966.1 hypothetical protein [Photorhabdus thracensis]NDK95000.1 hypothetical protein [Photorhabdus laumondii subsp. laumondii]NDL21292.1 hypothetical protein [Photorhabdus laumondii subsp. laumondii]
MTIAELIELLKERLGDDWENRELEIPDEFNGGWLTVEPENVVIESDNRFIRLDCWMSYPEELED